VSSVHLREFQYPDDYGAARQLWEHAGSGIHLRRSDDPEEIHKKLQRDPDLFLVAEADGRMIGTVMGGFDGRRGLVYHLAVAEPYRKQGVGNLLMEELENRLRLKGCIRCYLLVTTDNEPAIAFYERRGWKRMDDLYIYGKEIE
jgi:ribosomal protein S18 acetylase RimI-like enzyme